MNVSLAIARAWTDPDYKSRLLTDPNAVLAETGVEVPARSTVKVVENTTDTQHWILPDLPTEAGEVSMDELEKVAVGYPYDTLLSPPASS